MAFRTFLLLVAVSATNVHATDITHRMGSGKHIQVGSEVINGTAIHYYEGMHHTVDELGRHHHFEYKAGIPDNLYVLNIDDGIDFVNCTDTSITVTFLSKTHALSLDNKWSNGSKIVGSPNWGCMAIKGDGVLKARPIYREVVSDTFVVLSDVSRTITTKNTTFAKMFKNASWDGYSGQFVHNGTSNLTDDAARYAAFKKQVASSPTSRRSTNEETQPKQEDDEDNVLLLEDAIPPKSNRRLQGSVGKAITKVVKTVVTVAKAVVHTVSDVVTAVGDAINVLTGGEVSWNQDPVIASMSYNYNTGTGAASKPIPVSSGTDDGVTFALTCSDCYFYAGLNAVLSGEVDDYHLDNVIAALKGTLKAEIQVALSVSYKKTWSSSIDLGSIHVGDVHFAIGPVPVWMSFNIPISLDFDVGLDIEGDVQATASLDATKEFGVQYSGGSWGTLSSGSFSHELKFSQGLSATVTAGISLVPTLQCTVESIVTLRAIPSAGLNGAISITEGSDVTWCAGVGLQAWLDFKLGAQIGIDIDFAGLKLASLNSPDYTLWSTIYPSSKWHYCWGSDPKAPAGSASSPAPPPPPPAGSPSASIPVSALGSNKYPPAGYYCPSSVCQSCQCDGSGAGSSSCGELCCASSPTPNDGSSPCYSKCPAGQTSKGGGNDWDSCYSSVPASSSIELTGSAECATQANGPTYSVPVLMKVDYQSGTYIEATISGYFPIVGSYGEGCYAAYTVTGSLSSLTPSAWIDNECNLEGAFGLEGETFENGVYAGYIMDSAGMCSGFQLTESEGRRSLASFEAPLAAVPAGRKLLAATPITTGTCYFNATSGTTCSGHGDCYFNASSDWLNTTQVCHCDQGYTGADCSSISFPDLASTTSAAKDPFNTTVIRSALTGKSGSDPSSCYWKQCTIAKDLKYCAHLNGLPVCATQEDQAHLDFQAAVMVGNKMSLGPKCGDAMVEYFCALALPQCEDMRNSKLLPMSFKDCMEKMSKCGSAVSLQDHICTTASRDSIKPLIKKAQVYTKSTSTRATTNALAQARATPPVAAISAGSRRSKIGGGVANQNALIGPVASVASYHNESEFRGHCVEATDLAVCPAANGKSIFLYERLFPDLKTAENYIALNQSNPCLVAIQQVLCASYLPDCKHDKPIKMCSQSCKPLLLSGGCGEEIVTGMCNESSPVSQHYMSSDVSKCSQLYQPAVDLASTEGSSGSEDMTPWYITIAFGCVTALAVFAAVMLCAKVVHLESIKGYYESGTVPKIDPRAPEEPVSLKM